jgi:hypothetical protein
VAEGASTWLAADLAREIAALIPPGAVTDPARLVELIDDLATEAAQRCVELHPPAPPGLAVRRDGRPVSEHVTDRHLSTTGILDQEQRLWTWARRHTSAVPDVDGTARPAAVADAIAGHGTLVLVVGPAGTGKTTAVRAGTDQLRAQGRPVLGLAPSGKAPTSSPRPPDAPPPPWPSSSTTTEAASCCLRPGRP